MGPKVKAKPKARGGRVPFLNLSPIVFFSVVPPPLFVRTLLEVQKNRKPTASARKKKRTKKTTKGAKRVHERETTAPTGAAFVDVWSCVGSR